MKDSRTFSRTKDAFEPTDIKPAIEDIGGLGSLIFGVQKWESEEFKEERESCMEREKPEVSAFVRGTFTTYLRKQRLGACLFLFGARISFLMGVGLKEALNRLDLSSYDRLFLSKKECMKERVQTVMMKIDGKEAWTLIPPTT